MMTIDSSNNLTLAIDNACQIWQSGCPCSYAVVTAGSVGKYHIIGLRGRASLEPNGCHAILPIVALPEAVYQKGFVQPCR